MKVIPSGKDQLTLNILTEKRLNKEGMALVQVDLSF